MLDEKLTETSKKRVLVVDDDDMIRDILRRELERSGYQVKTAIDGAEALEEIKDCPYPVIITDILMPRMDGIGLLTEIRAKPYFTEVIIITGYAEMESAVKAVELGAFAYLRKRIEELERENRYLKEGKL